MVELGEEGNLVASPFLVLNLTPDEASFYFFRETSEAVTKTEAFGEMLLRVAVPTVLIGPVMRLDRPPAPLFETGLILFLYFAAVASCAFLAPHYRRTLEARADLAALRNTNDFPTARRAILKASGIEPDSPDADSIMPWLGERLNILRLGARESGIV